MNWYRWIDPRVASVRADAVRAYMRSQGWTEDPDPRPEPRLLVFRAPYLDDDGRAVLQILPSTERASDYRKRVEELLTTLSVLEDRHPVEVLNDVLRLQAALGGANGPAAPATPPVAETK
jgi:hypothetical protein